ncbi:MAG: type II toxin-antitoxin system RelB/DinJ family antitoxin [Coriobacteriia bacterium]|nr:type II toxin-antitoxin system RelB/DinJ family antitoxin [Coriobacteriia bacterium]
MSTRQLSTRVDEKQAEEFLANTKMLGTTPSDAMRMFIAAFNECRGFPYEVKVRSQPDFEPFASEEEATEFATRMSKRVIDAAR